MGQKQKKRTRWEQVQRQGPTGSLPKTNTQKTKNSLKNTIKPQNFGFMSLFSKLHHQPLDVLLNVNIMTNFQINLL